MRKHKNPRNLAKLGRKLGKDILILSAFAAAFLVAFAYSIQPVAAQGGGWWDSNWQYRAPITLTVHPDNYQIKIVLDKVDNLGGHCLDNFQDVRFTENETGPELNFWIQPDYISGDNATFFIGRVENDVPTGDNIIFCYYGNALAGLAENGVNTFIDFTDFSDNLGWTQQVGTWTVSDGILTAPTSPDMCYLRRDAVISASAYRIEAKIKKVSGEYYLGPMMAETNNPMAYGASLTAWMQRGTYGEKVSGVNDWGASPVSASFTVAENIWYILGMKVLSAANTAYAYTVDRGTFAETATFADSGGTGNYWGWWTREEAVSYKVDWVLVRKYASPEPTATVGSEEYISGLHFISVTVTENLIDRKPDYASSARLSTKITVRFYDNATPDNAMIGVRDNKDVLRENQDVTASLMPVLGSENIYEVSYTYNPIDSLPDDGLGPFDIWIYLADNKNTPISRWENNKFHVYDVTSTVNFYPVNPNPLWTVQASGVVSMYGLTGHSISGIQFKDSKYGTWWDLGTSSSWSKDYKTLGEQSENIAVELRVNAGAIDGLVTSSYITNENWIFQINLRWEENFDLVPAAVWDNSGAFPDNYENIVDRNWWVEFWFENYETQETKLTSTSSLVESSYRPHSIRVRDKDENYYRTYRAGKENIDVYMVTDNNLPLVTMYLITLDDPSTLWGPLNGGSINIYKFVGDEVALINDSYWMATNDVSVFLIRGDIYCARLEALGKSPFDYGRIDADYNTSKMISPGFGRGEYGETIHNIFYMVAVRYWTTGDNHIIIHYQDNYENTLWVRFTVRNMNGDVVFTAYTEGVDNYPAEWTNPDLDNIYDIEARFEHGMYGAVGRSFIYIPAYAAVVPEPPHGSGGGLEILGKPPVPWGHLLVFGVLMVVLVSFGAGHAGIGILATAMVAALLNLTGLVAIGWELVFFIVVIGILTQIFESRRGGG